MTNKLEVTDFNIHTIKLTAKDILDRFDYVKCDLDEYHKSDIIESILLRIPMKKICIHDDGWAKEHIFIGAEIIQSIDEFYTNSFKLTTDIIDLGGHFYYKELPRSVQRRIDQSYIDFVVLNTWKKDLDYSSVINKMKISHKEL